MHSEVAVEISRDEHVPPINVGQINRSLQSIDTPAASHDAARSARHSKSTRTPLYGLRGELIVHLCARIHTLELQHALNALPRTWRRPHGEQSNLRHLREAI
jgi:hypothetical protein